MANKGIITTKALILQQPTSNKWGFLSQYMYQKQLTTWIMYDFGLDRNLLGTHLLEIHQELKMDRHHNWMRSFSINSKLYLSCHASLYSYLLILIEKRHTHLF